MSKKSSQATDKRKNCFEEEGLEDDERSFVNSNNEPIKNKQEIGTPSEVIVDSPLEQTVGHSGMENAGKIEIHDSSENVAIDEVVDASIKDPDMITFRENIDSGFAVKLLEQENNTNQIDPNTNNLQSENRSVVGDTLEQDEYPMDLIEKNIDGCFLYLLELQQIDHLESKSAEDQINMLISINRKKYELEMALKRLTENE